MQITGDMLINKVARALLIVLILSTLVFIFYQSALSPELSQENSDAVGDILEQIIPPETPPGEFVQNNVRKLAHFFEFAVLGALASLYIILYHPKPTVMLSSFIFGLICALADETIQIFSKRGPAVVDIWIDVGGFCAAAAIFYTGYALYSLIRRYRKQKFTN